MSKNSDSYWIGVVLCFVFGLWPIGIILLLRGPNPKKATFTQKQNAKKGKRSARTWGTLLAIAGGVLLLKSFSILRLYVLLGGVALWLYDLFMEGRERREKKYEAIVGKRLAVPIKEIARAIPTSYDIACKDLQRLIDEGRFGEGAYLDMSKKALVLDSEAAQSVAQAWADEVEVEVEPEPEPKREPQPARAQPARAKSASADPYEEKLEAIRRVNREILDEEVSRKIYRIEAVTASIFKAVRDDEAKSAQAQSFMNYYLPTTLKLLTRYAQLEKTPAPGANIHAAMQNISDILDKLVETFEALLDRMYQNDVIDITSEISVLESMMAKDGMSNPYTFESVKAK